MKAAATGRAASSLDFTNKSGLPVRIEFASYDEQIAYCLKEAAATRWEYQEYSAAINLQDRVRLGKALHEARYTFCRKYLGLDNTISEPAKPA